MHAMGIDIGTTSICGVLIDASEGTLLNKRTITSDAFISTGNPWEKLQDVSKIISIAKEILDELVDDETAVIGLTGQMHGILYTDSQGKAVSPLYTWQDERGNQPYKDTTYAAYMGSSTGYGNVTDFYNREKGIRPVEAVSYCTIQDYLAMELCGLKGPVIHTSDAASFGCFDLQSEKFDLSNNIGPNAEIRNDYAIIGEYKGIPVSVAIGDNQASVFSTLADESGLLINVGTGSQVTIVSPEPVSGENIESRPYVEGKYLVVGAALCGGRAYSLLKDFYKEIIEAAGGDTTDVYGLMERMICKEQVPETVESSSLTVDTRFAGTRANPKLRGSITGIGVDNFTPGALTQGVLEGMTQELFDMYMQMSAERQGIVGSGNGIRQNKSLINSIERCFERGLKIPAHKEEAAYGAALFGLVACGRFKNGAEAQKLIKYQDVE